MFSEPMLIPIVVFLVLICLPFVPASIAERKGRSFFLWYLYGLFLWLVAVIHAACLQPNSRAKLASGLCQCRACREWIDGQASVCPHCRTSDPVQDPLLVGQ